MNFKQYFINICLFKPSNIKLILRDMVKYSYTVYSNKYHLNKAINWLLLAQQKTCDDGISLGYSMFHGWLASYPETSGYIIPTLLEYHDEFDSNLSLNIIESIAKWLCGIQLKNGAFQSGTTNSKTNPSIFNTGQTIFGLLSAYQKFRKDEFLESAIRAGDFLISNQENDGCWIKYCYQKIPHTYNVRTAWALLELFLITEKKDYKEAATLNYEWAKTQVNENYWFKGNSFMKNESSNLHFISYTIRGFLEGGVILNDNSLTKIAINSSRRLLEYFTEHRFLPGNFDENWKSNDSYSCLTGEAQLLIIWLKLFTILKNKDFYNSALILSHYLKSKQILYEKNSNVCGAIKGSDPLWGNYMSFLFPNWATKFFCDALMLESKIKNSFIN